MRRPVLFWTVALTLAFELVTMVLRFGFSLESSKHTASTIGSLTGDIRIHHGYVGVLLLLVAIVVRRRHRRLRQALVAIGLALVLSDLVHHFLVLWPIVGDPEFHLVYPGR